MKDRVVVITGGTSGYGRAMAMRFHEAGARVLITARDKDRLQDTARTIGCDGLPMDVTDHYGWARLVDHVTEQHGRIDVLINNAGGGVAIKPAWEQTKETIDATIALNLTSVIYGCSAFAPMLRQQRGGTVINLSSVCAQHCWPDWSVYAAAKAGVLNYSKGLYTELQPYRVRVTCLIPAAAATGFQQGAGIAAENKELSADDIAQTALYIARLPAHAVVEQVTVWGVDQVVQPL